MITIFYQLLPSECLKQIYVDTSGATSHSALMCTIEMVGACPAVSYAAKRFKERCHNIIKKHFLRVAVKKTDRNHTNILFRAGAVKECSLACIPQRPSLTEK